MASKRKTPARGERAAAGKTGGAAAGFRLEHDSMGELSVPAAALWGAQTQRAVQNFPISGQPMPREFIRALALIKAAAAQANGGFGLLDPGAAQAIAAAAREVADGGFDAQFPIDVYQTGSGTSSNMNANEVIATLATRAGKHAIHPNDHVNLGQSSNDTIPTAIRVAAALAVHESLLPALKHLRKTIERRAKELSRTVKTGRTHLMDAMPLTFGQEFGAWAAQLDSAQQRIEDALKRLRRLPIGGTAIGTGINADPRFGKAVAKALSVAGGVRFESAADKFEGLAAQDDAVELSGQLSALAVALTKIANDLRWMSSGPHCGLGELVMPEDGLTSSIMPGKRNPTIAEAMVQAGMQVAGNHVAVTLAGASGNFELNVAKPVLIHNVLQSIRLLADSANVVARRVIPHLQPNLAQLARNLDSPLLAATALNPVLGYDKAAAITRHAREHGISPREAAVQLGLLSAAEYDRLVDLARMARGG